MAMDAKKISTATTLRFLVRALRLLFIFSLSTTTTVAAWAQETPSPSPSPAATGTPAVAATTGAAAQTTTERPVLKTIKLNVQYGGKVPAARKHFYISRAPFNLEELQRRLGNLPSHKDYERKVASQNLSAELVNEFVREWLEKYRCETVYCQPITSEDVGRIRLFQNAYSKSSDLFKSARGSVDSAALALKWLPNFLPREIQTGYFDMKMDWVRRALALMESETVGGERNTIRAVMTDRKGEAYVPDIKPGATYYISNLIPIDDGKDCFLWNYKKEIKAGPGVEVGVVLGLNAKQKEIKGTNASALTFNCATPK